MGKPAGSAAEIATPRDLIDDYSTREVLELRFPVGKQQVNAEHLDGIAKRVEVLPDRVLVYTDDADHAHTRVIEAGFHPESTVSRRSTLEDVFLRLTGRTLVD